MDYFILTKKKVTMFEFLFFQEFIREGCLQKLSKKGYQQRMFFLVGICFIFFVNQLLLRFLKCDGGFCKIITHSL